MLGYDLTITWSTQEPRIASWGSGPSGPDTSNTWYWYWGIDLQASIGIGIGIEIPTFPGIGIGIGIDHEQLPGIGIGIGIEDPQFPSIGIGIGIDPFALQDQYQYHDTKLTQNTFS